MSPEQARGEPIDSRSDIFAAGVMLFELTTGRRLFKAASEYETFKLICERDCPLPSSIRPGYPPALEAIVMRALQKDPRERWQTAREMQGALEDLARRQRIGTSAIGLSQFMRSLFADKLSGQTEARQQDKKRADSIHFEPGSGEANIEGSGRPPSFAPTAGPRGGTEASEIGRGRMAVLALSVTAIAALAGVGVARWGVQSRTPHASVQTKSAARDPANPPVAAPEPAIPPPPSRAHGTIAVSSSPRGASIFVNGVPSSETTPVTFGNVDIGNAMRHHRGVEGVRGRLPVRDAHRGQPEQRDQRRASPSREAALAPA